MARRKEYCAKDTQGGYQKLDEELCDVLNTKGVSFSRPSYVGAIIIAVFGSFSNGLFLNIRGPCIDALGIQANLSSSQMGYFFLASGVGGMVAAIPSGYAAFYPSTPID